jgi:tRNA U34 2-thiouridine synthase MnmA/TrmU
VIFAKQQFGVCAGQSAVIHNGDRVVDGGLIDVI